MWTATFHKPTLNGDIVETEQSIVFAMLHDPAGRYVGDIHALVAEEHLGDAPLRERVAFILNALNSSHDPRDPNPSKEGFFRYHNCWKCREGEKPCVNGTPGRCDYPRARND